VGQDRRDPDILLQGIFTLQFGIWYFEIWICFGFRYSNFEFAILLGVSTLQITLCHCERSSLSRSVGKAISSLLPLRLCVSHSLFHFLTFLTLSAQAKASLGGWRISNFFLDILSYQ
jgi:hypothetical protein